MNFPINPEDMPDFFMSWTGNMQPNQPQQPQPDNDLTELAKLFGDELGKLNHKVELLEQALIEMQEQLNEKNKTTKTKGKVCKAGNKKQDRKISKVRVLW